MKKPILKFTWNLKGPQISKTILKKKNEVREFTLPDFKTYDKATVIQTMWYWCKRRHTDQCNRLKSPEIYPYIFGQLNF